MKKIPLTQGQFAIVDDEDFERLSRFKWHAKKDDTLGKFYAQRKNGSGHESMQHEILGSPPNPGLSIDHRNLDTLDNQKKNIRWATNQQQCRNRRGWSKTGYKGVSIDHGRFRVQMGGNKNRINVGTFGTLEEAVKAYDETALRVYGEFALLNRSL